MHICFIICIQNCFPCPYVQNKIELWPIFCNRMQPLLFSDQDNCSSKLSIDYLQKKDTERKHLSQSEAVFCQL